MNILYILQQSIYDLDRKWLTADSNIEMMRGIILKLLEKTDWSFYILIGKLSDFGNIRSFDEIIDTKKYPGRVNFIEYNFPVDAFINRQNFDAFEFKRILFSLPKIDIIWNNITELSRNIKTCLYYWNYDCKIVTSCYWLDCPYINEPKVPIEISYFWRQFDGFECSDLVTFTCDSTKKAFIEHSNKIFAKSFVDSIMAKSVVFDFGFNAFEIQQFCVEENEEPPIILFLNRLSEINYTRHKEFIEAIKLLYRKRKDFKVVFTNPSKKFSWDYLRENVPNLFIIKQDVLNREEYINLLWKSLISVHLYELERYGGVAHREAIATNNIVITPKCNEYLRIQGDDYPYYVNYVTGQNLAWKLHFALNTGKDFLKTNKFKEIKQRNFYSSYEMNVDLVINSFSSLL